LESVTFKVRAQVEDSIFSVHSNIAEGYSRRSLKEYINYSPYAEDVKL
jgi:four helix bundle protein